MRPFNPRNGQFTWTPGYLQAGTYNLGFGVRDGDGLTDTIDVRIDIADTNRAPELFADNHTAIVGQTLEFAVGASDPDPGTTLTFGVSGLPEGASFDSQTGQFAWTPGPGQTGDYPLLFTVSDGQATVSRAALLRSLIAAEPPQVTIELTPSFPAIPGQQVLVHAIADSVAEIATYPSHGRRPAAHARCAGSRQDPSSTLPASWSSKRRPPTMTTWSVIATKVLRVRDPADREAPVVCLGCQARRCAADHERRTSVGTVSDSNLDEWQLAIAPIGSDDFVTIASGEATIDNAALASVRSGDVSNGFYRLRLSASDLSRRSSEVETVIEVNTAAKPTQLLRSEVDLTVDFAGVPLEIGRQYDSLRARQSSDFGHGWRSANRDTQIQAGVPATGRESLGVYEPFRIGTRVYITLPDGNRVGFTFAPERHEQDQRHLVHARLPSRSRCGLDARFGRHQADARPQSTVRPADCRAVQPGQPTVCRSRLPPNRPRWHGVLDRHARWVSSSRFCPAAKRFTTATAASTAARASRSTSSATTPDACHASPPPMVARSSTATTKRATC